jgi:hypothetical protein
MAGKVRPWQVAVIALSSAAFSISVSLFFNHVRPKTLSFQWPNVASHSRLLTHRP